MEFHRGTLESARVVLLDGHHDFNRWLQRVLFKSDLGLTIIGPRKSGGTIRVNPEADARVESEDILIVIGADDKLATLRNMTAAPEQGGR